MKKAVLDVGSNSIKFLLAEKQKDGTLRPLVDKKITTRLGENLQTTGQLLPGNIEKSIEAFANFVQEAKKLGAEEIAAVGTMALRTASNSQEVIRRIRRETGVKLKVLTGQDEAYLSYLAVSQYMNLKEPPIIFDIGGASTEFIWNEEKRQSIPLGAVTITEDFSLSDLIQKEQLDNTLLNIKECLSSYDINGQAKNLVGVGGTLTTMAAVKKNLIIYCAETIHRTKLTIEDVDQQITLYKNKTKRERQDIPGLDPERADIILAGACIVKAILEAFNAKLLLVSDRGLRHGLMYKLFAAEE